MPRRRIRFLIASGPTREPIDPVRFISNYSTGTMGGHLERTARRRGHTVTWVRSPEDAETARELLVKLKTLLPRHDVLVMATAVCDVRPRIVSTTKVKKEKLASLRFIRNPDILATLAKAKRPGQVFVGFGLESTNMVANGLSKMTKKQLEVIFLQRVKKHNSPFGETPVEAYLLAQNKRYRYFPSLSKGRAAELIVREAEEVHSKGSGRGKIA